MDQSTSTERCDDVQILPKRRTKRRTHRSISEVDEDVRSNSNSDSSRDQHGAGDDAASERNSCRLGSISPISVVDEHQQRQQDVDIKPFGGIVPHLDTSSVDGGGMARGYHTGQSHRLAVGFHPGYCHGKTKSPFLLPAEIYKSLFASAVLQQKQHQQLHEHDVEDEKDVVAHIPRNLLFSYPDANSKRTNSPPSDLEASKPSNFGWSTDNNLIVSSATSPSTLENHINSVSQQSLNNHHPGIGTGENTNQDQGLSSKSSQLHSGEGATQSSTSPPPSSLLGISSPNNRITPASNSMPIGGVQGQNPTQGLVHWMSAVMAEHMTGQPHHDPTATVGMHYMWNGNVDQCGQHSKEIDYNGWPTPRNHMSMKQGYEAKMNDHHGNLQKGHIFDDGRLDHHASAAQGNQMTIYGPGGPIRTTSSNSNSPGGGGVGVGNHVHHSSGASTLLVVPQPINATKISASLGPGSGTSGRKYQCKMCPQIFSSKADLQLHTQIHMREAKPYKCSQCAKAFANSSYLSQHTRIHLGIKPYRCEICQRKFTQLSHLQQHIRTHTGDKPYKCRHPGCQKAFSQLSNLQSHSRCHQTDKPFKCNSCYKCFSDEPSLLEHIPKHRESKHLKTHICQYCGKSYTQETYLTKHMQKHAERTDKRPPITGTGTSTASGSNTSSTGGGGNGGGGNGSSGTTTSHAGNMNRNIGMNPTSLPPVSVGDHPYWPKVSPDSAANLSDVMHHHQHQHHQQQAQQGQQPQPSHLDQFPSINPHQSSQANGHPELQPHHRMTDNGREDIVSTPSTVGPYDTSSITKTTSNSAFTPINSMTPHLNTLSHHPMAQRPYLYDAISFQNKNVNQNNANSFPNQLISLHQIRNYAHQPAGLMAGEHLIGVSVGAGKDKG